MIPGNPAGGVRRPRGMRIRLLAVISLLTLVVAACGDPDTGTPTTTTGPAGLTGSIHRSGGFAGLDETWTLEADGTVFGPDGATGQMGAAAMADLDDAVEAAGFFDLDPEYLPADPCCDRFTYVVTLSDGVRTHSVTTMDGVAAPEALFTLIQVLLSGVQAAA